jgi:RNA polymerase sigma-70 factor, ECF subfamily
VATNGSVNGRRPVLVPAEPDGDTIERCRRGERAALESVFRAETPALERLLVRLAGPSADVEDLLQTTFVEAIGAFPRFHGTASVRTWLGRIAIHVVHSHLRSSGRRRRRVAALELVRDRAEPVDPAPEPDHVAHGRRQLERLYQHLDAIGIKKRLAFMLFVFDGRSIEEVAALQGASVVATKSRVFWARRELLARVGKDPVLRDLVEGGLPGKAGA